MDKLTFYINKVAIDDNSDLSLLDLPVAASVQACSGIARIFSLGGLILASVFATNIILQ